MAFPRFHNEFLGKAPVSIKNNPQMVYLLFHTNILFSRIKKVYGFYISKAALKALFYLHTGKNKLNKLPLLSNQYDEQNTPCGHSLWFWRSSPQINYLLV